MADSRNEPSALLAAARERGMRAVGTLIIPPGLDHFTTYAGLVSRALELARLIATEERDLRVIAVHHEIEMNRIGAAFREVELAMLADFERDASLREQTFHTINLLIQAGQYEIALGMYERLVDGFKRGALETLIDYRNHIASRATARLRLE